MTTGNRIGVEIDTLGTDLGGGDGGSAGGNVLSCNTGSDLQVTFVGDISAANNKWDHTPPSGNDIQKVADASVNTTGATVAAGNCP